MSQLQSRIDVVTQTAKDTRKNVKEQLTGFVNGCNQVADAYKELADVYEKETEEWTKIVKMLLECVESSSESDGNFNDVMREINSIKTDVEEMEAGSSLNIDEMSKKITSIKTLIENNKRERDTLSSSAREKCDKSPERSGVLPEGPTARVVDPPMERGGVFGGGKKKGKKLLKLKKRRR